MFVSIPQDDAVTRDWTRQTLVLDVKNTLGEMFHFEIQPGEKDNLPTRATDSLADKHGHVYVNMLLPIV